MNAPEQTESKTPRFAQVPIEAIEGTCSGKLTSEVFRYYVWLCSVSNRDGQSWWSLERQAGHFGASTRTIRRWRQALTEQNLVDLEQRPGRSTRATVLHHPQRFFSSGDTPDTGCPGGGTPGVREGGHPVSSITINKNNNPLTTVVVSNASASSSPVTENDGDDPKRAELENKFEQLCNLAEESGLPNFRYARHWLFQPNQRRLLSDLTEAPQQALRHAFAVIRDNYPNLQQPQKLVQILLDRVASYRPGVSTAKVQKTEPRNPRTPRTASNRNRRQSRKLYPDPVEPSAPPEPAKQQSIDAKIRSVWIQILAAIQASPNVPDATFNRWFKHLGAKLDDSGIFTVICEDEFDAMFTRENFTPLLELFIKRHLHSSFKLKVVSPLGEIDPSLNQSAVLATE